MNESGIISWEICQLVRFGLFSDEQAVRSLIHAYTAGEISLGKAAEIMGISSGEMKDILSEK